MINELLMGILECFFASFRARYPHISPICLYVRVSAATTTTFYLLICKLNTNINKLLSIIVKLSS